MCAGPVARGKVAKGSAGRRAAGRSHRAGCPPQPSSACRVGYPAQRSACGKQGPVGYPAQCRVGRQVVSWGTTARGVGSAAGCPGLAGGCPGLAGGCPGLAGAVRGSEDIEGQLGCWLAARLPGLPLSLYVAAVAEAAAAAAAAEARFRVEAWMIAILCGWAMGAVAGEEMVLSRAATRHHLLARYQGRRLGYLF